MDIRGTAGTLYCNVLTIIYMYHCNHCSYILILQVWYTGLLWHLIYQCLWRSIAVVHSSQLPFWSWIYVRLSWQSNKDQQFSILMENEILKLFVVLCGMHKPRSLHGNGVFYQIWLFSALGFLRFYQLMPWHRSLCSLCFVSVMFIHM